VKPIISLLTEEGVSCLIDLIYENWLRRK